MFTCKFTLQVSQNNLQLKLLCAHSFAIRLHVTPNTLIESTIFADFQVGLQTATINCIGALRRRTYLLVSAEQQTAETVLSSVDTRDGQSGYTQTKSKQVGHLKKKIHCLKDVKKGKSVCKRAAKTFFL